MHLDLAFTVTAQRSISADHGYALYGAVSRVLPDVHRDNGFAIHPLRGRQFGDGLLMLMPWSALTLRLSADQIPSVLPLAGKSVQIGQTSLRIGVPQVYALEPASALRSRLVVIKVAHIDPGQVTEEQFGAAARKQLETLGIAPEATLTLGKRRTLRIKDAEIVGYELIAEGLTAEESLTLQEHGLGGRHHMGCGVFVPCTMSQEAQQSVTTACWRRVWAGISRGPRNRNCFPATFAMCMVPRGPWSMPRVATSSARSLWQPF